jgi:hypothetical protein
MWDVEDPTSDCAVARTGGTEAQELFSAEIG